MSSTAHKHSIQQLQPLPLDDSSATALYSAGGLAPHDRNSIVTLCSSAIPSGAGALNSAGVLGWHVPALLRNPRCCTQKNSRHKKTGGNQYLFFTRLCILTFSPPQHHADTLRLNTLSPNRARSAEEVHPKTKILVYTRIV